MFFIKYKSSTRSTNPQIELRRVSDGVLFLWRSIHKRSTTIHNFFVFVYRFVYLFVYFFVYRFVYRFVYFYKSILWICWCYFKDTILWMRFCCCGWGVDLGCVCVFGCVACLILVCGFVDRVDEFFLMVTHRGGGKMIMIG